MTFKGTTPKEGTLLHARVIQPQIGDLWLPPTKVRLDGTYTLVLGVVNALYVNSVVDFYVEGVKAEIQGLTILDQGLLRYEPAKNRTLDLVFP